MFCRHNDINLTHLKKKFYFHFLVIFRIRECKTTVYLDVFFSDQTSLQTKFSFFDFFASIFNLICWFDFPSASNASDKSNGIFVLGWFFFQTNFDFLTSHF